MLELWKNSLKGIRLASNGGPRAGGAGQFEKAFFDAKFGTGPVQFDAVARMIEPERVKPINKKPVPARTTDGEPLTAGLKRVDGPSAKFELAE